MSGAIGTATMRSHTPNRPVDGPRWHAFPGKPLYVNAARAYVVGHVADWPEDDRYYVGVCASELATNTVLHTRSGLCAAGTADGAQGRFGIRVFRSGHTVRVEVADYGTSTEAQVPPAEDDGYGADGEDDDDDDVSMGGRGLGVVANLSAGSGYYEAEFGGRVTWFEYTLGVPDEAADGEVRDRRA